MTAENATPPQDPAAELRAAVRAVERGERSAADFFTRPAPPPRAAARRPAGEGAPPRLVSVPADVPALLAAGGAPESLAPRVVSALGEGAAEELRADPWRLLAVAGVRPEQADGFARALLGDDCAPDDERRTRALTVWLLERAALAGHTALEPAAIAKGLVGHAVPDPDAAVRDAIEAGAVLVLQHAVADRPAGGEEEAPVRVLLGLDRYALAEESLADGLARLGATFGSAPGGDADWAAAAGAAPSASAAELIRAAAGAALVVHTGGEAARAEPAALVAAARSLGLRAYAATHTEDGRRRLAAALPDGAAVTVTGLLTGAEGPERDAEGLLPVDLLAVLDAAQLGAEATAALVESLPDGARLVLSGDPLLLGAAGPGQVLTDVLGAGLCPHIASRTPDPGPVGELVSGIGVGELAQVAAPENEVVTVPVRDAGEAVHRTVQLVADSVPRAFGVPAEEVRVITPGHGGAAGTRALNAALKDRLNPGPGRFGGFDPGDRVAHSPAPGRTRLATVADADAEGLWLTDSDGRFRVAREAVADTVRHGWAITAHQAAGSRWPAAVVVLPGDAAPVIDRPWVYTAFSRGERHLSVVQGAGPALAQAVGERPGEPRTTRLRALLAEQAAASAPAD
ncbi:helix-hairpin-helix domain-containing protein [Streptomyces sp. DSM 44938]|uniref:Helix-hairpin-helix domain-containing protein n=1 Tax=Streptomyces litchfieldiae TaxID=3075543 RepID=A0ABU2MVM4_9ACTN|nr:helix-hairpin-helix domain-containing protein [Streptomyces sp. DSM 44938]MDT0345697.1 helix-hairpin-helix domain-containing protein [Streptomyces sp. DSM 44938]